MLKKLDEYYLNVDEYFDSIDLHNLSKCIILGLELTQEINKTKSSFFNHDIVVLALYRKLLEQLDGLLILIDHGSGSATSILLRSIFETTLSLLYILKDEKNYKNRALAYYINYALEEIIVSQKKIKDQDFTLLSKEKLQKTISSHKNNLSGPLKEIYSEWQKSQSLLEKRIKRKYVNIKWYSLFNGPTNLKQLSESVKMIGIYNTVYSIYSLETHAFGALKDIKITNNGLKFLDLRDQNSLEVATILGQRLFSLSTVKIIKSYIPDYLSEFNIFYESINLK